MLSTTSPPTFCSTTSIHHQNKSDMCEFMHTDIQITHSTLACWYFNVDMCAYIHKLLTSLTCCMYVSCTERFVHNIHVKSSQRLIWIIGKCDLIEETRNWHLEVILVNILGLTVNNFIVFRLGLGVDWPAISIIYLETGLFTLNFIFNFLTHLPTNKHEQKLHSHVYKYTYDLF